VLRKRATVAQPRADRPATAAPATEPAGTRFPALARPALVIVLCVLVAAVLGVNLLLFMGWHGYREQADARSTGQVTAVNDTEKILSYDYRSLDKSTSDAEKLMTPSFKKKYADTADRVRADAPRLKAVVKAQVVASSVVDAKADQVKTLLFVNQTTTRNDLNQPRVDLNRVVVTLVKDGNDWLVDNVQAL
jgi:Mce-associated membrane protein